MSEQAFEEQTLSSEGVTVTKRFEEDEFPVPAIAFEFESTREEEVTIRLSDAVPDSIAVEDLGFHPEYGSEYWTMDEDQITFERSLTPGAEYTTVYGIRATGSDNIEQFLNEPEIESVDPPLPESADGESDDDTVKDALASEGELSLEEGDVPESDEAEDIATLELEEPALEAEDGDVALVEDETEAAPVPEDESLVSALTTEIQHGQVSEEELAALREALGVGNERGSAVARLDQLQRDITDLRAYTAALEEFLDENGTGAELITELDERVETVAGRVTDVESELDSVTDTVEAELTTVTEDVGRVETELSAMSEEIQTVDEELGAVTEDLNSTEETLSELEEQVETLEGKVTDEDVKERVEEVAESISDLKEWQEQIKKTFGGG